LFAPDLIFCICKTVYNSVHTNFIYYCKSFYGPANSCCRNFSFWRWCDR